MKGVCGNITKEPTSVDASNTSQVGKLTKSSEKLVKAKNNSRNSITKRLKGKLLFSFTLLGISLTFRFVMKDFRGTKKKKTAELSVLNKTN